MASLAADVNPAPTFTGRAPLHDPGSAKRSLVQNSVAPEDLPAASEIPPPASSCKLPESEPHVWTDNICEICWLPVRGKRPRRDASRDKKNKSEQQAEEALGDEYWLQLPCKHRFGSACLHEWRKTEDQANYMGSERHQCPTCKAPYFHHTCHKKSRWKAVRGCRAIKDAIMPGRSAICVRCELDAIDTDAPPKPPRWERGFGALAVGLVMVSAIPHNQRYGYEPVTPSRQRVLRHLPTAWIQSMGNVWDTSIEIKGPDDCDVLVVHTGRRRPRKPSRKEKKAKDAAARARRKQRRNLVRKDPPGVFRVVEEIQDQGPAERIDSVVAQVA